MFLKSVKARGFKSFGRPAELAFEPGITVVVGPNGSGKSNIADSVMWAMGEQSPTAVRGSNMQDIIFSGSDSLSPAGMAEVEILLDNSCGVFPIEFSEVLISRRLYRGGEGAYYINRSACRLIDVVELLSDAGLGNNTHSIISQGRVDAILESRPVERRAYIEEAAGLGKYKKRKHRAGLKLEAVRRNLERLADVEEEVKANLRPLKRQATAAERSLKLDLGIAAARARLIKGRLAVLSAELEAAEAASREAAARRGGLEQQLAATAEERRRTEELLATSLRSHKNLASRFYGLKSQQESLAQRSETAGQRRDMLLSSTKRAEARIENLRGQIKSATEEFERVEAEHREDVARLKEVETELAARQTELAGIEEEIDRRRRAGAEKTRKAGELNASRDRYSHQIEYLSQRKQKLAASMEKAVQEVLAQQSELDGLNRLSLEEEKKLLRLREQAGAAGTSLEGLKAKLAGIEERRRQVASELRRVGEDLQIAKARLTFIGDSDRDRSGLPPAAKKLSEDHAVKSLVDLIDVEPGYEQAVSAVLGSMVFAVAVNDFNQARQLFKAVQDAGLGSVEFIIPRDGGISQKRGEGGDCLADHVNITGGMAGHIAALLGGVRVVDSVNELPAEAESGTWVTRDGVVYRSGRRLLSYKADPPSSVVLKHRNERRQLEKELKAAAALHLELEKEAALLDKELETVGSDRADAEEQLRVVQEEMRETESGVADIQRQQGLLEQEIELRESGRGDIEAEALKLTRDLEEAERLLGETETALAEASASSGAADQSEESLAETRMSLAGEVTGLQVKAARVRERERVASLTMARVGPSRQRLQDELSGILFKLGAFRWIEPAFEKLLENIERLKKIYGQVAGVVGRQLRQGEEQSERHSASLRRLSREEAGLQQELSSASDATTGREVGVAKCRDQIEEQSSKLKALESRYPDAGIGGQEAAAAGELEQVEEQVERLSGRRELIGPVNPLAQQEYDEMLERQQFLAEQRADLEQSLDELTGLVRGLAHRIEVNFNETFEAVRRNFSDVVSALFPGGEGRLALVEPEPADGDDESQNGEANGDNGQVAGAQAPAERRGIEISVKPARKAVRSLTLLSGGERSLVAIAFLFAIFLAKPAPFYILDEVEAALDDLNISRLLGMLRRYQDRTQFIVITHQKRTMEVADVLYGVSMGSDGTSRVLSRKMPGDGDAPAKKAGDKQDEREPAAIAG